jgi:hypothetical protein
MEEENDLDQLFKRGLNDPEIPFNELDWEKMERKLDAKEKKRIVPLWLITASGIAAVLAIFLSWYFLAPVPADKNELKNPVTDHPVKPGTKKENPVVKPGPGVEQQDTSGQRVIIGQPSTGYALHTEKIITRPVVPIADNQGFPVNSDEKPAQDIGELTPLYVPFQPLLRSGLPKGNITALVLPMVKPGVKQPVQETDSSLLAKKANALANSKDPFGRIDPAAVARNVKKKMETDLAQQHNLILSAMAGPDISSAKTTTSTKVSSNLGMLATYAFTPKISVTSGAMYANKLYNYSYTSGNSGREWEVDANCDVLDIPVNVNYKLLNKKSISVSINTGLSSYFMLKEKYDYTSGEPGAEQRNSTVNISNENQHIFGVANVSVTFDHQISRNLSVGVQPFAKVPLTGIGFTDANLKSAGVAFSLNIGLFPAKKPGKYAANR